MKTHSLTRWSSLIAILFITGLISGCTSSGKKETDQKVMEHSVIIKEALAIMESNATQLGEPVLVADSLFFGNTKMNNNYGIVDSLTARYGCTATFFMKKDDGFIRISTDVMKDGIRAEGTQLDPSGPVIAAIQKGEAFYGVVDILGSSYETGYEPIIDSIGNIIGIYYVGFQLEQ